MLLKIIRDVKNEELGKDFFMWEKDQNRQNCRNCQNQFSTFKRRHHCRLCGGLFCEACTTSNVVMQGVTQDRLCCGCLKRETPGARVRSAVETRLSSGSPPLSEKIFTLNVAPLNYGSPFEPGSSSNSSSVDSAPKEGYFEMINKSPSFCAVKLMVGGNKVDFDTWWEIPRPAYISVPPNELINVQFTTTPSDSQPLELFVLYANPNIIPGDLSGVVYDTKSGVELSPCASIENFWQFAVYRIEATGKNVLLKFKGDGAIETRLGNSIERNGFFGKLTGGGKESSTLDFSTNISSTSITRII